jgi:hypothetical protein
MPARATTLGVERPAAGKAMDTRIEAWFSINRTY